MREKSFIKNVITPVLTYGLLLIFSLVTSRIILVGYGSETNGLVSTVNQIYNFLAIFELGIGTATTQALYAAIGRNEDQTKDVLAASQSYFRSVAAFFFVAVVAIAFLWPTLIQSDIPYWTIWGLVFFQGASNVISLWYTVTIKCYLAVSGLNFVNNNVHFYTHLITYFLKLLICGCGLNIVFISLSLVVVNIGKCIFYRRYMRRVFSDFFIKREADRSLLKQRNSFLIQEIAAVLFYGTDTIIISLFCGLTEASIYAVYALVVSALRNVIGQIFAGTKYVLGKNYKQNRENYLFYHDVYSGFYLILSFVIYTVAFILLIPFVSIYTKGIQDAGYLNPILPVLFVLIELLSACRIVDGEVIRFSYHAKATISRTIIEAAINLTLSLICVQFMGLYGVLVGTIVALGYRTIDILLYTNHRILNRSARKECFRCVANFAVLTGFIRFAEGLRPDAQSIFSLCGSAVLVLMKVTVVYVIINLCISRELLTVTRKVIARIAENRKHNY